jgi:hypothetical protein
MKTHTHTTNKYRLSAGWSDDYGNRTEAAEHPLDDIQGFIKGGEAESSSLRYRNIKGEYESPIEALDNKVTDKWIDELKVEVLLEVWNEAKSTWDYVTWVEPFFSQSDLNEHLKAIGVNS